MKLFAIFLILFSSSLFSQCENNTQKMLYEQISDLIKAESYVVKIAKNDKELRQDIKLLRKSFYIPKGRYKYFNDYDLLYNYLESKGLNLISYERFDSLKIYDGGKVSYRFVDIIYNKKNRFYVLNVLVFGSRTVGSNIYYTLQCKNGEMILTRLYSHGIG